MQTTQRGNIEIKRIETTETKQPLRYREDREDLSEWEAARLNSKTWSMEQE